jgi:hypothetical protein
VAYKDDYYEDLTFETAKALFQAMKDGKPLKPGSQIGRQGACPEGGPTTLRGTA